MLICNVCGAVKIVKPWKPLKIGMDLHALSGLFLSGICSLLLRILSFLACCFQIIGFEGIVF